MHAPKVLIVNQQLPGRGAVNAARGRADKMLLSRGSLYGKQRQGPASLPSCSFLKLERHVRWAAHTSSGPLSCCSLYHRVPSRGAERRLPRPRAAPHLAQVVAARSSSARDTAGPSGIYTSYSLWAWTSKKLSLKACNRWSHSKRDKGMLYKQFRLSLVEHSARAEAAAFLCGEAGGGRLCLNSRFSLSVLTALTRIYIF